MRKYELLFIVRPDTPEEALDKLVTQMEGVVSGAGGKVEKTERMGRRRLAYRVGGFQDGHYVLFVLEGSGETVKEFERRLRVTDSVIKYITVRVDEEQKRIDKQKALRAKQEARKPRPKPAAAPPPFAVPPAAESTQA
ncbi:MAG TPA: 30S ribosomal protein S6 [Terriglobia bacterium]|nr:30S ribosomal protein S6 [Terriglobia bacterium]